MHGATVEITPQVLLKAYACGIFPMAESADDPGLYWVEPRERGVIPLDGFHVSARLRATVRSRPVRDPRRHATSTRCIAGCAAPRRDRSTTWINARIRGLYGELFDIGHCHTVETWRDGRLVGGLYGVRLGAAFFGESMFHRERDASKVALVHLVARLRAGGFSLLDTQFEYGPPRQFGAVEVPGTPTSACCATRSARRVSGTSGRATPSSPAGRRWTRSRSARASASRRRARPETGPPRPRSARDRPSSLAPGRIARLRFDRDRRSHATRRTSGRGGLPPLRSQLHANRTRDLHGRATRQPV